MKAALFLQSSSASIIDRNYNNLPEVRRKVEEEKKRVVSQTNRQRMELFKKVKYTP